MQTGNGSEILGPVNSGGQEEGVVKQREWGAIRTLRERGMSKKAIARELEVDIKTVRKWLKEEWKEQRRKRGQGLDKWREFLQRRAPEVGFNAAVLLREARGQGYEGCYQSLVKYIRPWREEWSKQIEATMRYETGPAEQSQVDWGSIGMWIGEQKVRAHLFTMVLGHSRRIFAKGYLNERMDSLLDGHQSAFEHLGRRTRTILYDNPRTIVLRKDEAKGEVEWNTTFKDRMDFYGVEIRLCRYYRAQTKGKVESGVKYVKRNALAGRRFGSVEDLNQWLTEWCVTVADQRIHGTTHERPAERFGRAEAEAMISVEGRKPCERERVQSRIVPRDCQVVVETNRYPVPVEWAGRRVDVRLMMKQIVIGCEGAQPLSYERIEGKHLVAKWNGEARSWKREQRQSVEGPPRFDPVYRDQVGLVEVRGLEAYEAIAQEVTL